MTAHDGTRKHDATIYHDGEEIHRLRLYEYEFDVVGMRYLNASIHLRPDAISPDYQTAFTFGPKDQGDVSGEGGVVNRMWRIRVIGKNVYVARTDNSFTGN